MEKEKLFVNAGSKPSLSYAASSSSPPITWHSSNSAMELPLGELNCSSEQLPICFLNLNWENSMDQSVPFESALSSIVSSPATSNATATVPTDSVIIRELIGKLGSICNSGEISPTLGGTSASYIRGNNSANTSCYNTPLNSPPKLYLSMMDHQGRGNLPILENSMPTHPSLAPFFGDPGFAERAARSSCFGNRSFGGLTGQFGFNEPDFPHRSVPRPENGKLSRVSSSQSLKAAGSQMGSQENKETPLPDAIETEMRSASASASASASDRKFSRLSRSSTPDNAEFVTALEESSVSEQIPGGDSAAKASNDANSRKRKATPRGKAKNTPSSPPRKDSKEEEDPNAKRSKPAEATANEKDLTKAKEESPGGNNVGDGGQKQTKDNSKPPEPPKDYIHVRARRGQATDSHSLAERVRREKISERMKFLQDLVPGCNKVTGKAVMLDEIINYVQSLQRQVEFLSMKLATVNPRLDFNVESLLSKEILQTRGSLPHPIFPLDSSASAFPYGHHHQGPSLQSGISSGAETQCSVNPLDAMFRPNLGLQLPSVDGFAAAASQLSPFWEDDLQSVVQMDFGQNQSQEATFQPQSFNGSLPTGHMKVEL